MDAIRDILISLLSSAIWATGAFLFTWLFSKKDFKSYHIVIETKNPFFISPGGDAGAHGLIF